MCPDDISPLINEDYYHARTRRVPLSLHRPLSKEIGDKQNIQYDIDKVVRWSGKWQMLFNFGKCKCLHTEPRHTVMNYAMGGTIISN